MNDPENFLSRWSLRKQRAADKDSPRPHASERPNNDQAADRGQGTVDAPASTGIETPSEEFDVTSLPPIESISAGTDISAFMKKGVPTALRHAALRRAWSADPAIRDFMGPTENYWDAAGPEGVPGFGDLDPNFDIKRMIADLFGEGGREEPAVGASRATEDSELSDEQRTENNSGAAPQHQAEHGSGLSQRTENAATQKTASAEPRIQKPTRRHGGALPE